MLPLGQRWLMTILPGRCSYTASSFIGPHLTSGLTEAIEIKQLVQEPTLMSYLRMESAIVGLEVQCHNHSSVTFLKLNATFFWF